MASTDKIQVRYLVFDDDDEAEEQYSRSIKIEGYDCIPIYINPGDFFDAEQNLFRESDFVFAISEKTKGVHINLIVTDWNIIAKNDIFKGLVGWDIIQYVINAKEKLISRPFFIYSSDIKKASNYILSKISDEVCKGDDKVEDLSLNNFIANILKIRIKFWKRDGTQYDEITTLLKESNTISNIVLDSILSFDKNLIIKTGNDSFDGKKISEIINSEDIEIGGLKFVREFIELAISHYSELNE